MKSFLEYINENTNYSSDKIRINIIENSFKFKNTEPPNKQKLIDTWDGYDDLCYIEHINDDEFIYYEGFVKSCWDGFYSKSEYKDLNYVEVVEKFVKDRANKYCINFGYELVDYKFYEYRSNHILELKYVKLKY